MKGLDLANAGKLDENFSNTIGGFGSHQIALAQQAVTNAKVDIYKKEAEKQAAAAALLAAQQAAFLAQQAAFLSQQQSTQTSGSANQTTSGGGGSPTPTPEPTKSTVVEGGEKIYGMDSKVVYGGVVLLGAVIGYFAGKQMKKSAITFAGIGAGIGAGASFAAHKFVFNKQVKVVAEVPPTTTTDATTTPTASSFIGRSNPPAIRAGVKVGTISSDGQWQLGKNGYWHHYPI